MLDKKLSRNNELALISFTRKPYSNYILDSFENIQRKYKYKISRCQNIIKVKKIRKSTIIEMSLIKPGTNRSSW